MTLLFGVLLVAPLISQAVNDELLITIPEGGDVSSYFVVRLHLVELPPFVGIDLLQQQTSYAQD